MNARKPRRSVQDLLNANFPVGTEPYVGQPETHDVGFLVSATLTTAEAEILRLTIAAALAGLAKDGIVANLSAI